MRDTQGRRDERAVDLQRVGVKNVELPFRIREQRGAIQTVLAKVRLSVDLPHHYKGTHMSRFIEVLEKWKDQPSSSDPLQHILEDTRQRLQADRAHIKVAFKYFLKRHAPVSRRVSTMGYDCEFDAMLCAETGYDLVVGVVAPITTVCPCSKEISTAGAHNQRAWLRVKLRTVPGEFLWLEDLIAQLETFGSCEIYPLVKRADEKYVTEKGYHNPKFVEDVLRDVVLWLRGHPLVTWFEVECEADESIHLHNAFAYQQEPLPPAVNVFAREIDTHGVGVTPPVVQLRQPGGAGGPDGSGGTGGTDGANNANGASGKRAATAGAANHAGGHAGDRRNGAQNGAADDLPDVASRRPE